MDFRKVYQEVFEDTDELTDFVFSRKDARLITEQCDGKVVSGLFLVDKKISVKGHVVSAALIMGAATSSDYRGQGYMSALIKKAQEIARENGITVLFLSPSVFGFYERFGFTFCERKELRSLEGKDGCELKDISFEEVCDCFEKFTDSDVTMWRSAECWRTHFDGLKADGGVIKGVFYHDELQGYVVFSSDEVLEYALTDDKYLDKIPCLEDKKAYVYDEDGQFGAMWKMIDPVAYLDGVVTDVTGKESYCVTDGEKKHVFEIVAADGKITATPCENYQKEMDISEFGRIVASESEEECLLKDIFEDYVVRIADSYI